jgi:hypothetical protein
MEANAMAEQTFSTHTRVYPPFHLFVLPVLGLNLVWSIYRLFVLGFSLTGLVAVLTALALVMLALTARVMALKVQDRVIRLEERLRLERMLPDELWTRIPEFTTDQLVALRFACDAELPALAKRVLDENMSERKTIKSQIQNWRPDYQRA